MLSRYLDARRGPRRPRTKMTSRSSRATRRFPCSTGSSDVAHPCQALADVMTIRERFGRPRAGAPASARFGDGNNVCASLLVAATVFGMHVVAATPPGYEPSARALGQAREAALRSGGSVEIVRDPRQAVAGADALATDVWTSMGQEGEQTRRCVASRGLPNRRRSSSAPPGGKPSSCIACPPTTARRSARRCSTARNRRSWDQAENRLHAQKALLALVVGRALHGGQRGSL